MQGFKSGGHRFFVDPVSVGSFLTGHQSADFSNNRDRSQDDDIHDGQNNPAVHPAKHVRESHPSAIERRDHRLKRRRQPANVPGNFEIHEASRIANKERSTKFEMRKILAPCFGQRTSVQYARAKRINIDEMDDLAPSRLLLVCDPSLAAGPAVPRRAR